MRSFIGNPKLLTCFAVLLKSVVWMQGNEKADHYSG